MIKSILTLLVLLMKNYLIVPLFVLSGCVYDPGDSVLKIINKTDRVFNMIVKVDTVETLSGYGLPFYTKRKLLNKDTLEVPRFGQNGWRGLMRRYDNNKLYLFISNQNLDSGSANGQATKAKLYKVISYSKRELDELNWEIDLDDAIVGKL